MMQFYGLIRAHSIFDVVRDFLHDEAVGVEHKILSKYLKPDLLIPRSSLAGPFHSGIFTRNSRLRSPRS